MKKKMVGTIKGLAKDGKLIHDNVIICSQICVPEGHVPPSQSPEGSWHTVSNSTS
jgi:hypothetical protein